MTRTGRPGDGAMKSLSLDVLGPSRWRFDRRDLAKPQPRIELAEVVRFRVAHAESPCGCEVAAGKVRHRLSMEEMNTRGAFQRLESERVVATVCGRHLRVDSVQTADLSALFVDSTHRRGFSVRDATTA